MKNQGGQSMVGALERVLVCNPAAAGWGDARRRAQWMQLGYLREPDAASAGEQHAALRRELERAGAEVLSLPPSDSLTLDAVYTHDPSLLTADGMVLLRMGKTAREAEPAAQASFFASAQIEVVARLAPPAVAEGGDLVWLDTKTLLAGRGFRTNSEGIAQLRAAVSRTGAEVVSAPLVFGQGPAFCLHLMSLMSMLDETTILVDYELLAVETVELLESRGFRLLSIDVTERATLACNVLALGKGRLLALEENPRTNMRLHAAGFDVRTFPGSELCLNGGGGPTCLTRPLGRGARH